MDAVHLNAKSKNSYHIAHIHLHLLSNNVVLIEIVVLMMGKMLFVQMNLYAQSRFNQRAASPPPSIRIACVPCLPMHDGGVRHT